MPHTPPFIGLRQWIELFFHCVASLCLFLEGVFGGMSHRGSAAQVYSTIFQWKLNLRDQMVGGEISRGRLTIWEELLKIFRGAAAASHLAFGGDAAWSLVFSAGRWLMKLQHWFNFHINLTCGCCDMTIYKLAHESQLSINGLESTTKVVLLMYFASPVDVSNAHNGHISQTFIVLHQHWFNFRVNITCGCCDMTIYKSVHESKLSINGLESATKVVLLVYFASHADS